MPEEQCKTQTVNPIKDDKDPFTGVVCHCYTDLCNDQVPKLPDNGAGHHSHSSLWMCPGLIFILIQYFKF